VTSGSKNVIIAAIDTFEILSHVLIDLGFEIIDLSRGATVKVVVNLY